MMDGGTSIMAGGELQRADEECAVGKSEYDPRETRWCPGVTALAERLRDMGWLLVL